MTNRFFALAFFAGLLAVGWVGWGFVGTSWLALAMTAVIGGVFLLGANELRQFRAATLALSAAMDVIPAGLPTLGEWLARVPASLRDAVRLRVESERGGLPGPALTPYLAGLLVMLGMLGTFLGMVLTFKGAVFALEGSADLQAVRSALAAPIKGLGLAFGTSVAGVATSAMLGLMSAISRRERLEAARRLDALIATVLRPFSLVHERQETFRAAQVHAGALPLLLERLDAMAERMERRSSQLDEQLLARQAEFQREATVAYGQLAHSVAGSLQDSLAAGTRLAGENIRPVIESSLTRMADETARMQQRLGEVSRAQVEALSHQFSTLARTAVEGSAQGLQAMAAGLEAQWRRLGEESFAQHQAVCTALENTARQLAESSGAQIERSAQLLDDSAALVRARTDGEARWIEEHAGRMDQLSALWRDEMSRLEERDRAALQERTGLVEQLATLMNTVNESSSKANDMAAHVTGSALALSSLAEAFGQSVQLYHASSTQLTQGLKQIEASINRSTTRSDEQLAYYVAQAREVIDLSIASQQGLYENLRQLQTGHGKSAAVAQGVSG